MNPAIFIYDAIGDFGIKPVLPLDVAEQLKAIEDAGHKTVDVFMNSPGGEVFAGISLHNLLFRSKLEVVMHVDGLAASAASIVLMAGDKIIAAPSSVVMLHEAWTVAAGNANEFDQAAAELRTVDAAIAGIYATRTGQPLAEIRKMLAAETWLSAEDARTLGFVDEIAAPDDPAEPRQAAAKGRLATLYADMLEQQARSIAEGQEWLAEQRHAGARR